MVLWSSKFQSLMSTMLPCVMEYFAGDMFIWMRLLWMLTADELVDDGA